MDEDGRWDYRLRRSIPGAQEGRLPRYRKSGDTLARCRHARGIVAPEHGRHERLVAAGRRNVAALGRFSIMRSRRLDSLLYLPRRSIMVDNKSRRDFVKSATLGATGMVIVSRASSYASILGANDRVRVGIVGYSDRCRQALIPSFMMHAKELNFDLAAVSDIWSRRRDEGAAAISKLVGHEIVKTRNNEELYDRKDVDAVIIATADFQHALHGVEAVRAGRDAYVEKPMANTMEDAK